MLLSISDLPTNSRDRDRIKLGVKMSKCLNNEGQLTLFASHETVSWRHFTAKRRLLLLSSLGKCMAKDCPGHAR
ncbi:hypothetical protein KZY42_001024 [Vibrio vulnificus]|nr:hypothetical protein [Vibrio vulnificus]POC70719.1 hypothetical protein CRN56_00460 [Vibrio vulnificus Env1]EGR0070636.1 hypothetical protein [Vibrio vulnificus]EGR0206818.1 hypothetical protein [Vibrio vulnificus]EHU9443638.1 hypothetical protein [Vibrio vulnificus]